MILGAFLAGLRGNARAAGQEDRERGAALVGGVAYGLSLASWLAGETRRYLELFREGAADRGAASDQPPWG